MTSSRTGFAREFYAEVAANGRDFARIYQLKLDGADVAQAFGLVLGGRFYYLLIGADYERFGKHSPGLVLYDLLIEEWIKEGGTVFDFTIGDEAFKRDFGTTPTPIHALVETSDAEGTACAVGFRCDARPAQMEGRGKTGGRAALDGRNRPRRVREDRNRGVPGPPDRSGVRRPRLIRPTASYLPSSTDLARAASTASASSFFSRSSPIRTPSAAAVVPFGLVTCLRSTAGSSRLVAASEAAP